MMIKGGVPEDRVYSNWKNIFTSLTNYTWIAFFPCPQINMPAWPKHIVRKWKKHIAAKDSEPWLNWGYFISEGGTPSGKAS
jgi:hypothetical protein